MGAVGSDIESICQCTERRPFAKQCRPRNTMSFEEAFHRENILDMLDAEIDRVFQEFDLDRSGKLEAGHEFNDMLRKLLDRGYAFGRKLETNRAISDYKDTTVKNIRRSLLVKILPAGDGPKKEEDIGMSLEEFRDWFRNEVVTRRTNLRILLATGTWLQELLEVSFDKADVDDSGEIEVLELKDILKEIAYIIGEPPPSENEVYTIVRLGRTGFVDRLGGDDEIDEPMSFREFRYVMIEYLARTYYTHFNCSMNSHRSSKSPRLQISKGHVGHARHPPSERSSKRQ